MGLTCGDVMVSPHIQKTVGTQESVATAFKIIRDCHARFLPVVDDAGRYVGVFTAPTLLKLILPRAATIESVAESSRMQMDNLAFLNLSKDDFHKQLDQLKDEKVVDHLSDPDNIPIASPQTPILEGIFLIHRYKRHLILVDPDTKKFVGTVSANSLLEQVLA